MKSLTRDFPYAIAAAIFDFDETMIDLEAQHTHADAELCRAMGNDHAQMPESFRFSSGRRIIDNIREMRAFFGWKKDELALFEIRQRLFDEACASAELELMPGVERAVRRLHEGGMRMAITSSAVRSGIEAVLRRFDLLDCFEMIVDGSEVEQGKPDPEAYEVTARKLRVEPQDCIVFEDSQVGVEAAKRAGMFCVAVRNPTARLPQDLEGADAVLDSFEYLDVDALLLRR
jgi:HAD superfamily hydrolase (TIGR01509 family)